MNEYLQKPDLIAEKERKRALDIRVRATKERARANALLANVEFREWAKELMLSVGFFGEGRELTPYQQGRRGGIVEIIERLCELADDGDTLITEAFRDLVKHDEGNEHGRKR